MPLWREENAMDDKPVAGGCFQSTHVCWVEVDGKPTSVPVQVFICFSHPLSFWCTNVFFFCFAARKRSRTGSSGEEGRELVVPQKVADPLGDQWRQWPPQCPCDIVCSSSRGNLKGCHKSLLHFFPSASLPNQGTRDPRTLLPVPSNDFEPNSFSPMVRELAWLEEESDFPPDCSQWIIFALEVEAHHGFSSLNPEPSLFY